MVEPQPSKLAMPVRSRSPAHRKCRSANPDISASELLTPDRPHRRDGAFQARTVEAEERVGRYAVGDVSHQWA
jgi:hypothetical protein